VATDDTSNTTPEPPAAPDHAQTPQPLPQPLPLPQPASEPVPAAIPMAAPMAAPVPAVAPVTTPSGAGRPWRWVMLALGVIAVAVAAFSLVLYRQEGGERDDAEQALTESRSAQADAEDRADVAEARATEAEAARDESAARATEAETRTADAEAARDEAVEAEADYADAVADFLAFSTATGLAVDEADAACIADAVVDAVGPRTLDLLVDGTGELGDALVDAAEDCGVDPADFEPVGDSPLEPGTRYGDNPVLDALYDQCEAGDGAACDQLFKQSEIGSEYELFGFTCGGRFEEAEAPEVCEGTI
jgi:hypothetical protein